MGSTSSRDNLGVGIVGLSATRGWAASAHVPALRAVDGVELRALSASSRESARVAANAHDIELAHHDVTGLVSHDEVDLVVVAVKVPSHRSLVLPALAAGKPVLCEWPLGVDLDEARELADAASGIRTFVGLQGRVAPATRYLRHLIADGYVGEVLSTTLVASGGLWGDTTTNAGTYMLDRAQGATMLTIPMMHAMDVAALVLGELTTMSAVTATRRPQVTNRDTGDLVPMTAEDQVVVSGLLTNGAVASFHYRGGMSRGTNLCWEINGTEGDLQVIGDSGHLQNGMFMILGARGKERMARLAPPGSYDDFPALAGTPANAVAHAYAQIVRDLREGSHLAPDFAHAVKRHLLVTAIQQAS
jgi:predicted dehydrogenase